MRARVRPCLKQALWPRPTQPKRIRIRRRIVPDILIQVHTAGQSDGGFLGPASGVTRVSRPSYLEELLVLAHHTGRRISAILALRYRDIRLDRRPYPSIRWPADTDKTNREALVPVSSEVRAVLESIVRERPGIGAAPIFPAATDPSRPTSTMVASSWLLRAERLAGVEKHDGSLWHAYRRGWATARKHLPDVDVAAAGGWADTTTLRAVYQQADESTMYRVVSEPMQIRQA